MSALLCVEWSVYTNHFSQGGRVASDWVGTDIRAAETGGYRQGTGRSVNVATVYPDIQPTVMSGRPEDTTSGMSPA